MNASPVRRPGAGTPARRRDAAIAWSGGALFAGSLAYFLFSYAVTFGEIAAGTSRAGPIVFDIGLFTVFALHHSVFARERVRAPVARLVGPGLERSVYVWVASLMLIGVCALWQPVPGAAWQLRGPRAWLLPLAQLIGVWLTLRSAAIIDVWELAGVRQAARGPEGAPPSGAVRGGPSGRHDVTPFKTDGPYGWVRHPIYLGWLLLVFPVATMTMTRLVFALVSTAYLVIAIPLEERSLRRTAGGAYQDYMTKVRWRMIPGLY